MQTATRRNTLWTPLKIARSAPDSDEAFFLHTFTKWRILDIRFEIGEGTLIAEGPVRRGMTLERRQSLGAFVSFQDDSVLRPQSDVRVIR